MASSERTQTKVLLELHEYLDWMQHWGNPRSPREETNFYNEQVKIQEQEITIKPLAQRFKLYVERFIEDFEKEPTVNMDIGATFIQKGNDFLESLEPTVPTFEQEQTLVLELQKLVKLSVERIQTQLKAKDQT